MDGLFIQTVQSSQTLGRNGLQIPYNPENKPGAYFRSKHFLGLIFEGAYFQGVYFWDGIHVKKGGGLIIE